MVAQWLPIYDSDLERVKEQSGDTRRPVMGLNESETMAMDTPQYGSEVKVPPGTSSNPIAANSVLSSRT